MNIALLFGIFPDINYSEIVKCSHGVVQYAADALQKSFIEGLGSLCSNIKIINLPYLGSYPKRYSKLFSPTGEFQYVSKNGNIIRGVNEKYCNLMGVKMYDRYCIAKHALKEWCNNQNPDEKKVVIIYAIHTPFVKACVDVKEKYCKTLKIVLIVPDLPEYMSSDKSCIRKFLENRNNRLLNNLYKDVDAYVLLSKYMAEKLPVEKKPWTVVEGIFNNVADDVYVDKIDSSVKQIFYSGTLAKRYGIMNLVHAFTKLQNKNYRLVICGDGDALDEIRSIAKTDDRILYKGQLPRNEVLKLQKSADLLVNPRTPDGEFTKYSFPSKTMEYLVSGVPTLLYKLPGIPDEYYQYCYSLEKLDVDSLSEKIDEILSNNIVDSEIGRKARKFILTRKNPIEQCKKVVNLLKTL